MTDKKPIVIPQKNDAANTENAPLVTGNINDSATQPDSYNDTWCVTFREVKEECGSAIENLNCDHCIIL